MSAPTPATSAAADPAAGPPRRAHRRAQTGGLRWSFWLGLGLLLAGLGMLGWFAWQMWGTNVVSRREQRALTEETQKAWRDPESRRVEPRDVPLGDASALIRIPRFGKDYVMPVLEGIGTDVLSRGIGHFPETAHPGQVGNYALAGHRVTHGEPLRRMPELRPGDEIVVETARRIFTYRLTTDPNRLVIPFTGTWVLDPLPANPDGRVQPAQKRGQRLFTLTTCSELFHTDNRMIAFGVLLRSTAKPNPT